MCSQVPKGAQCTLPASLRQFPGSYVARSRCAATAIPAIFTGLRVGFALTLIGSLLAERFASQRGLGYLLMNGTGLYNVELIMSVTLVIVVFAFAVSYLLL